MKQFLPEPLRDSTFSTILSEDVTTKKWLIQLLVQLNFIQVQVPLPN